MLAGGPQARAGRSLRVLVFVEGDGSGGMTGPEIRAWEMARELGGRHEVAVVVRTGGGGSRDGNRLVSRQPLGLVREALRADAVVAPWVPPYLLALLARRDTLTVADLYDPVELEVSTLKGRRSVDRWLRTAQLAEHLQLELADLVLCAGESQRAHLESRLVSAGLGGERGPDLRVVEFGVGAPPPQPTHRPLRERFPEIGTSDPVVLWWGSIWRWLDAETAIRAVAALTRQRPDVRLVFTAGAPPRKELRDLSDVEGARALADSLGLLGTHVFFLTDWVPYESRHEYLQDADVGLTLHRDPAESERAARARYLDYLWTGLPCVLSQGDETAARFSRAGFARTVPAGDVERVAEALEVLLGDPTARRRAREAASTLAEDYRWPRVLRPLTEALEVTPAHPRAGVARAVARAGRYYARKASDLLAARARP